METKKQLSAELLQTASMAAAGFQNSEIAQRLEISSAAVKWRIGKLMLFFCAPSRAAMTYRFAKWEQQAQSPNSFSAS